MCLFSAAISDRSRRRMKDCFSNFRKKERVIVNVRSKQHDVCISVGRMFIFWRNFGGHLRLRRHAFMFVRSHVTTFLYYTSCRLGTESSPFTHVRIFPFQLLVTKEQFPDLWKSCTLFSLREYLENNFN